MKVLRFLVSMHNLINTVLLYDWSRNFLKKTTDSVMPPGCYECRLFSLSKDQQEDCGKCARTDSGQCREDARDQNLRRNSEA